MSADVLVVDDSLTVRMDLAEALGAAGLGVVACATAEEARSALSREPFAVAILDVLLPDGDGVDLLREIRSSPSTARMGVMLLSSEAEVRDRIRGLTTGADDYVGKPYETSYVVARARDLLRRAHTPSEARVVLLIDDSLTFRETLREALESASYRVVCAETGEDGLRIAASSRPAAVIVDGVMPGIDGATVIRRIRLDAALRRTPCLLLTASEEGVGGVAELAALDAGADGFVRKEERLDVILARLGAILRATPVQPHESLPSSLAGPKKILAVDDSPTYLDTVSSVLRAEGFEVALARSGEEALDLLAAQPVDCILLDLMMPGLGGEATCQRIKGAPGIRDIPVILLTALEDREAMIHGLGAGADDYIAKSGDFTVLKARVLAQIRRKQFEDETRHIREQLLHREVEAAEARAARELAETRAAMTDELRRKNAELETFSYSVSHDLRAPLRAIGGFSRILLEDYSDKVDAVGQDYLRRMNDAADRMGDLIEALLQLSRIGRAELRRGPVDLSRLARDAAKDLSGALTGSRHVAWEIQDGVVASGDARLLRVVIDNLFGNALKFTSRAEAPVIRFGANRSKGEVVYVVADNGAGFDMAHAHELFAPFRRLHKQDDFPGTGIGLATVYRVIDRHRGKIWAEGEVGRGAKFFWTLPARGESEAGVV
ncbi:MAG: response regulator [Polyangiaceae bacterium]|jgi:two-component system, NtrC family, sensor kinase